ncbi:MAG: MCE family protein [Planctomycetes bacterium]|nr:MCE family protein [Planctomycetota bacterium]
MTERTRNIAVGVTALGAMVGLAYMVLLFGDLPAFARRGYLLTLRFTQIGSLERGSEVRLNGIRIGTITDVALRDDPREGVNVRCRIERGVRIPADAVASIGRRGLGGGGYIQLTATGPAAGPVAWLATDDSARLQGAPETGGLLGPEFATQLDAVAEGFAAFSRLADTLNAVLTTPDHTDPPAEGLAGTIQRLNSALDGLGQIANNPDNQANLAATLDNLRRTSGEAAAAVERFTAMVEQGRQTLLTIDSGASGASDAVGRVGQRADELAARLIDDADQLGRLLARLNQAAGRLDGDDSTAGRFLTDPALYNNLLESTDALNRTLVELQAMLTQWRTEGLKMKLN